MIKNLDAVIDKRGEPWGGDSSVVIKLFDESVRQAAPMRVALIGTHAPRSCGIATFTADIRSKLAVYCPEIIVDVYAMDSHGSSLIYESDIKVIKADRERDYITAARIINESMPDVVWLQHEFGIFGGTDGAFILELVDRVVAPLVTTFHTVLPQPSAGQRNVIEHLLARCARAMVMSVHGRDLMVDAYRASPDMVEIIEHGAPDRPFVSSEAAKAGLGLAERKVLTTFGLLGPGKGIEQVIAAMPAIIDRHPDVVYRILGATHPVLVAREGERYRERLMAQAEALGVADHIMWENRFLGLDELLEHLDACDIYVTPSLNLHQSTSGTLSYAVALGKAVVSTPYVHARELLAGGVGCLIDSPSPDLIADAVNTLLADPDLLLNTQERAYNRGRRTVWSHFAEASARMLRSAQVKKHQPVEPTIAPGLSAVWAMSDSTGMLQHSIGVIPDRRHGYCLDDNARALMLMNVSPRLSAKACLSWSTIYASFVQYAWNADAQRFRNFMRFDRSWCEEVGSEDSNGRALWALGHTAENSRLPDLRIWASGLFHDVIAVMPPPESPRAMAFGALGAVAMIRAGDTTAELGAIIERTCNVLARLVEAHRRPDWAWFEAVLGYDNPRLCQALIEGGMALAKPDWIDLGIEMLDWIERCQTSAQGYFRPIGSESFGWYNDWKPFDQQPLEAQAAIDAAHSAWIATRDRRWVESAQRAYQWFFGANDRGAMLADLATGRCRDGVTPRGRNENSGAESILAFQLGHCSLAALLRKSASDEISRRGAGLADGNVTESNSHSGTTTARRSFPGRAPAFSFGLASNERPTGSRIEPRAGGRAAE